MTLPTPRRPTAPPIGLIAPDDRGLGLIVLVLLDDVAHRANPGRGAMDVLENVLVVNVVVGSDSVALTGQHRCSSKRNGSSARDQHHHRQYISHPTTLTTTARVVASGLEAA